MTQPCPRFCLLAGLMLVLSLSARAGTVHGIVKNGTTGETAAGVEVILIQLQGGMQPVANAKSDAQGQFSFDNPSLGAQPMLVRAVFHGVNFHQPVPPGKSDIQVEVFEPTQDAKAIGVPSHIIIVQPNGSNLTVGEEYSVQNNSNPPQAYFRADGSFEFALPEKAQLQQAAAWGPSGMPVVQATMDKTKNHFAIAFAFRPGNSGVRYSYELPYAGNTATLKLPTLYPHARLLVVAPPSVQIAGDGLEPRGQEQGMNIYGRDALPTKAAFALSVSGTAPPISAGRGGDGAAQGQDAQPAGAAAGSANVQPIPGRLDVLKWPLIAGFLGVFALGAILLARRPVVAVAGAPAGVDFIREPPSTESRAAAASEGRSSPSKAASLADVDAAVGTSLDSLKDEMFRLELRRQAGTISEEEYARERARAEKVLRDLVRG
jgi:hypothetical protein